MRRFFHLAFLSLFLAPICLAQSPDYDAIADNLVNQSLSVQPAEVILVNGTPAEIDLMAAIQVAISKAGGETILQLNIPKANKRSVMETPMEHLSRLPTSGLLLNKIVDGVITVGSIQDPDLFADVPEERLSAGRKSFQPLSSAFNVATLRTVALGQTGGIPTKAYAKSKNADFEAMAGMFWEAVAVSPNQLADDASLVAGYLSPGTEIKLTSEAGTDLTFTTDDVEPRINAGRTEDVLQASGSASVWLPAGEAYTAVEPSSANGRLVIPHMSFRGEPIRNLELTFSYGAVTDVKAESGADKFKTFLASLDDESKMLSVLDVGVNPSSKQLEGSPYLSWEMGGLVTLMIGNNTWTGGDNDAESASTFHVSSATLTAGGKVLVRNGELTTSNLSVR